jgi:tRNA threonylcarbamoyladenosine modification (KEOPS) complex  Pcc1 subunit
VYAVPHPSIRAVIVRLYITVTAVDVSILWHVQESTMRLAGICLKMYSAYFEHLRGTLS